MNLHTSRFTRALCWLALPVFAFAQTAPKSGPAEEPAKKIPVEEKKTADDDSKTFQLQEFEVTGTRIRTLGQEQGALPVLSIPQIELERRGVTRLADIRWAVPQLGGSIGYNDNMQNSGTSPAQTVGTSFNLRGVGGNSTLVLVDGRRIPHTGQEAPGGAGGREDFSVDGIPISAIERIEVLPQGAGAIYGAEAIAGVVNVILKKNFRGAELRVTYDNTFSTDAANTIVSLTAGYRTGKLSTFITLSAEDQNALLGQDRWWTSTYDTRKFGDANSNFLFNPASGPGTLSTQWWQYTASSPFITGLNTHVVAIPAGSTGTTAANAAYTTTIPAPFDAGPSAYTIGTNTRLSAVFKADYELTSWANLYFEGRASKFRYDYIGGYPTLTTQLPAGYPGNPFNQALYLQKVFVDLPRSRTISAQENQALTLGVRGSFLENWRYDASASFARNIVSDDALTASGFNFGLLSAAMASANKPVLAYDSSKVANPNAAGVLEALLPVNDHKDTSDNYQYSVMADGPVWKGWAGEWHIAVGAEASTEKVKFWREQNASTPTYVLTKPFKRDLTAAFGEVSIPLLSDAQHLLLVDRLEIGGAWRASDYSDIGSAVTPTYRAFYRPVKWIAIRASRSEGFKPVRLYDLLAPVTELPTTVRSTSTTVDPARGNTLIPRTDYLTRSGGNPALHPEESVSRNVGIVIDVPGQWFKGLSVSVDYYDFSFTERSGSTSLQTLLHYFPERVFRNPLTDADRALGYTGGTIKTAAQGELGWDASNINLAGVTTKGWDYRVSYDRTFDFGRLSISASLSDPNVTWEKATPAATPTSAFGHQPRKTTLTAFWGRGPWDAGVTVNQQAAYYIQGIGSIPYPEYTEVNPQVSYNFGYGDRFSASSKIWWERAFSGSKITVTIKNAFNEDAEVTNGVPRYVGDPRLRRYILSLTKKF
ncbi:MAG: TonB-dependent receptor plug domain-containing protein [Opitutae bacterium]|nr:TonB-dependent receptor plug domain-containing protein [Opitutae bacterium]